MKDSKVLLTKTPQPVYVSWSNWTIHMTNGSKTFKSLEALKAEIQRLNLAQKS